MLSQIKMPPSYVHQARTGGEARFREAFIKLLNKLPEEEAQAVFLAGSTETSDTRRVFEGVKTFRALEVMYTYLDRRDRGQTDTVSDFWEDFLDNARSIRNRLQLVEAELARAISATEVDPVRLLSIGSGSARPVLETVTSHERKADIEVMLLDIDEEAITFSEALAEQLSVNHTSWKIGNFLRFTQYCKNFKPHVVELVGLLDYMDDRQIVVLLGQVKKVLAPQGYLITGSIMPNLESAFVTNGVNWPMTYRTPEELQTLLVQAGFPKEHIRVGQEPLGVHAVAIAQVV